MSESGLTYPEITMLNGGTYYKFDPQKDIDAWESAKLTELFTYIGATKKQCDWWSFVSQNGLERHFIETQIEEE